MKVERKKLYLYTGINFLLGIIIGIILFYGQLRNSPGVFSQEYSYGKNVRLIDFFRVSWMNIMWLLAIFMAHNILPAAPLHPILSIRGCLSSFSGMYMLHYIGIREAVASILPQCLSVTPVMMLFSVAIVEKRRRLQREGKESFSIKHSEVAAMFAAGVLAAAAEIAFFRLFCYCLF